MTTHFLFNCKTHSPLFVWDLFHHLNHKCQYNRPHGSHWYVIAVYLQVLFHYLINVLYHQHVYLAISLFYNVLFHCEEKKIKENVKFNNKSKVLFTTFQILYIFKNYYVWNSFTCFFFNKRKIDLKFVAFKRTHLIIIKYL